MSQRALSVARSATSLISLRNHAAPTIPDMDNPDDALLTAAERAREAEERLIETPVEDPTIVPKAHEVYQRTEEVGELAKDAAEPQT